MCNIDGAFLHYPSAFASFLAPPRLPQTNAHESGRKNDARIKSCIFGWARIERRVSSSVFTESFAVASRASTCEFIRFGHRSLAGVHQKYNFMKYSGTEYTRCGIGEMQIFEQKLQRVGRSAGLCARRFVQFFPHDAAL